MTEQIDILLATYQGAAYLREQIDSILNQTHSHFHLWIRDDGSTDETLSILSEFAKKDPYRLTVVSSDGRRLGAKKNFSELMTYSRAPYILFADQDDYWLPHKIERTIKAMRQMEAVHGAHLPVLIHTDLTVVGADLTEIAPSFWKRAGLNPSAATLARLLVQNNVTGCAMAVNRALLDLAQPIPDETIMHDWWLALVASAFGQIAYVQEQTILYRQHATNEIGAKRYGLKFFFKERLKEKNDQRQRLQKTCEQAGRFLLRYDRLLTTEQKELVGRYHELPRLSYLKQKKRLVKHGFFKQGFLRNLNFLIFS